MAAAVRESESVAGVNTVISVRQSDFAAPDRITTGGLATVSSTYLRSSAISGAAAESGDDSKSNGNAAGDAGVWRGGGTGGGGGGEGGGASGELAGARTAASNAGAVRAPPDRRSRAANPGSRSRSATVRRGSFRRRQHCCSRRIGDQANIYLPRDNNALKRASTAGVAAVQYTEATPLGVIDSQPKLGFKGITGKRQLVASVNSAYSGTQFDPWIPDSAVCVGRLYIVQIVNYAIVIYNKRGRIVRQPQPLNEFFGVMPANSTRPGDFINKATCVFDATSGRFFLAAAWLSGGYRNKWDRFGQTRRNADGSTSGYGIVVAASSFLTPMMAWNVYFIPSSNDGVKSHNDTGPPLRYPGRVYWGATPRITVDRFGVYLSTRQYAMQGKLGRFVGSNIYAIHKPKLYLRSSKRIVRFAIPMINYNSFPVFGLEPQSPRVTSQYGFRGHDTVFLAASTSPSPSLSPTPPSHSGPSPTPPLSCSHTPLFASDIPSSPPRLTMILTMRSRRRGRRRMILRRTWCAHVHVCSVFKGHVWMAFPSGYSLDPTSVPSVALVKLRPFLRLKKKKTFPTLVKKLGSMGSRGRAC
ncbi:hypothetical protein CLOM_g21453 [Closterium sp. NIES-68]|nr:hypothetical protein CLOM_g21453 [Closterium sp. NIES-68]